jgi:rubredoxin/uncharacterized membrane protein
MKKLVRCKACGYIMEEGSLKHVCPACGVPKTAFEPYESKVSEKRETFLSMHIHPILVHLPQGFIILYPVIIILGLIFSEPMKSKLLSTSAVIGMIMPILVIIGIITGIIDGKVRFKKLKTPFLIKKIVSGSILLVLSLILSVIIFLGLSNYIVMLVFSVVFTIFSAILGKIGTGLTEAKLPG